MSKVTTLVTALALWLMVGCQPITPVTIEPEIDLDQTTLFPSTTITGTTIPLGSGISGPIHCVVHFEATVRQGPSAGVELIGMFDFKVGPTGVLHGKLLQGDQSELQVAGQVVGRAVNLVFILAEGKYIFGVGTALNQIKNYGCGGVLGGPFVGPEPGDAGDWLAITRDGTPSSAGAGCDEIRCLP